MYIFFIYSQHILCSYPLMGGLTYISLSNTLPTFIAVRVLPLRDMISLGAWRMGLGCSGEILPSPSSPPPSSPTQGGGGAAETLAFPEIKSQKMRLQAHFCDLVS